MKQLYVTIFLLLSLLVGSESFAANEKSLIVEMHQRSVSIADHDYSIDDQTEIAAAIENQHPRKISIQPDPDTLHGDVVKLMDAVHAAGVRKVRVLKLQ